MRGRPASGVEHVVGGVNDILQSGFNADAVRHDVEAMQRALISDGATVLTFTLPSLAHVMPVAKRFEPRVHALNAGLRAPCAARGAILVDVTMHETVGTDPRMWSIDRLHANSLGHERIAYALAHAIGLPGAMEEWQRPLAPEPRSSLIASLRSDVHWMRTYLLRWLWRHSRGRSSGDGLRLKRQELLAMTIPVGGPPKGEGVSRGP